VAGVGDRKRPTRPAALDAFEDRFLRHSKPTGAHRTAFLAHAPALAAAVATGAVTLGAATRAVVRHGAAAGFDSADRRRRWRLALDEAVAARAEAEAQAARALMHVAEETETPAPRFVRPAYVDHAGSIWWAKGDNPTLLLDRRIRITDQLVDEQSGDVVEYRLVDDDDPEVERFTSVEDFRKLAFLDTLGATVEAPASSTLRGHAANAIVRRSNVGGPPPRQVVYRRTGLARLDDGRDVFLHAGGALGAGGPVEGVRVRLGENLDRYELPAPLAGEELQSAFDAHVACLDLAPDSMTVAMLGADWRAPLGHMPSTIYIAGLTETGKSRLAALVQAHYGPTFSAKHLPGGFRSTLNRLEHDRHFAADVPFVIDDHYLRGSENAQANAQAALGQIVHSQYNADARGRLDREAKTRASYPATGTQIVSAEVLAEGSSDLNRTLIVRSEPRPWDRDAWDAAEEAAAAGLLAGLTATYIADHLDDVDGWRAAFSAETRRMDRVLAEALDTTGNRVATGVAELAAAWGLFGSWARSRGLIGAEDWEALWGRIFGALAELARAQAELHRHADAVEQLLADLRSLFASHAMYLSDRNGDEPPEALDLGWEVRRRRDNCVDCQSGGGGHPSNEHGREWAGFVEDGFVYLEAGLVHRQASIFARATGRVVPYARVLHEQLNNRGLLATTDLGKARSRYTVSKRFGEGRNDFLCLSWPTLWGDLSEAPEPAEPAEPAAEKPRSDRVVAGSAAGSAAGSGPGAGSGGSDQRSQRPHDESAGQSGCEPGVAPLAPLAPVPDDVRVRERSGASHVVEAPGPEGGANGQMAVEHNGRNTGAETSGTPSDQHFYGSDPEPALSGTGDGTPLGQGRNDTSPGEDLTADLTGLVGSPEARAKLGRRASPGQRCPESVGAGDPEFGSLVTHTVRPHPPVRPLPAQARPGLCAGCGRLSYFEDRSGRYWCSSVGCRTEAAPPAPPAPPAAALPVPPAPPAEAAEAAPPAPPAEAAPPAPPAPPAEAAEAAPPAPPAPPAEAAPPAPPAEAAPPAPPAPPAEAAEAAPPAPPAEAAPPAPPAPPEPAPKEADTAPEAASGGTAAPTPVCGAPGPPAGRSAPAGEQWGRTTAVLGAGGVAVNLAGTVVDLGAATDVDALANAARSRGLRQLRLTTEARAHFGVATDDDLAGWLDASADLHLNDAGSWATVAVSGGLVGLGLTWADAGLPDDAETLRAVLGRVAELLRVTWRSGPERTAHWLLFNTNPDLEPRQGPEAYTVAPLLAGWSRPPLPATERGGLVHVYDRNAHHLAVLESLAVGVGPCVVLDAGARFDRKLAGRWRIRLTDDTDHRHDLDPWPFPPSGAWWSTEAVDLATERGIAFEVEAAEVWPRRSRPFAKLAKRCRQALADLGDDPTDDATRRLVKATYAGLNGFLRAGYAGGDDPLRRPEWGFAIADAASANLHRVLTKAAAAERHPLALAIDAVSFASSEPDATTAVPPGLRLGTTPGTWKVAATMSVADWERRFRRQRQGAGGEQA
jgi:hypothetical protein